MTTTLDELRRFTIARNFPKPTTLNRALQHIGFVQADPIRAPARAQDLILRQRVKNYHAGDLERRYTSLDIEEDFFVNYGYVTRSLQALMHPRSNSWLPGQKRRAKLILDFVRQRGEVHPREVDEYFAHGRVTNYWGGSSNATTHLLDAMHYAGLLRIVRREKGIRVYAAHQHQPIPRDARERRMRIDALADVLVHIYAPLPGPSLLFYLRRLRYAAPHWRGELPSAIKRAQQRLSHARVRGVDWYWPADESAVGHQPQDTVRLLAPFDPAVHDRARFELLWNWIYRFEAYTPAPKRKLGYYAMPLLWRERVIGWANLSVRNGELEIDTGYVASQPPRERMFQRELEAEIERMRDFLRLPQRDT